MRFGSHIVDGVRLLRQQQQQQQPRPRPGQHRRIGGHYFHDSLHPEPNCPLLDDTCLETPRKVFITKRALLDGTGKEVLQGVIIDNHGNGDLFRIQILVLPTIGRKLFSVKTATRKDGVSIFDLENPSRYLAILRRTRRFVLVCA